MISAPPGLPGERDMPNREPMPPFFGGQQPGGDVRYSTPPTPLGSQALPSGEYRDMQSIGGTV